jgi:hypothetical protein
MTDDSRSGTIFAHYLLCALDVQECRQKCDTINRSLNKWLLGCTIASYIHLFSFFLCSCSSFNSFCPQFPVSDTASSFIAALLTYVQYFLDKAQLSAVLLCTVQPRSIHPARDHVTPSPRYKMACTSVEMAVFRPLFHLQIHPSSDEFLVFVNDSVHCCWGPCFYLSSTEDSSQMSGSFPCWRQVHKIFKYPSLLSPVTLFHRTYFQFPWKSHSRSLKLHLQAPLFHSLRSPKFDLR